MIWLFRRAAKGSGPSVSRKVDAAAIVRRARRLRFQVRAGALSALSGAYLGARPGVGLTFAELRAYEPGDDVRHLDWNVTARQGRPYVRRYVEERSLTLWLIVDVSASLRFGSEGQTKADRAAQAAALLATAAAQNGDRVGLLMVSDRVEAEVPPGGGDRHLARLVRALVATPSASRRTDLGVAIARLRHANRRALVVVLSDFLDGPGLTPGPWRRSARRHEIRAIRLTEPRESALPEGGLLALNDAETGVPMVVDTGSRKVRDAYAAAAAERASAFERWCGSAGVSGHEISTTADPIAALVRIFHGHPQRRGRP